MTYDVEGREARRLELCKLRKGQLISTHIAGAGCLMRRSELQMWTMDELTVAILDAEFGPLPQLVIEAEEAQA